MYRELRTQNLQQPLPHEAATRVAMGGSANSPLATFGAGGRPPLGQTNSLLATNSA